MTQERHYRDRSTPENGRPSSFWMHDAEAVFGTIALKEGDHFLDVGCGLGEYSLHASKIVGENGTVYAVDKSSSHIFDLQGRLHDRRITNIEALAADAIKSIPVEDACVDVCMLATVLHIPEVSTEIDALLSNIRRVLKPDGRLAILECSKKDMSFGPPAELRLSSDEITTMVSRHGFRVTDIVDLGFNYLLLCSVGAPHS